MDAHRDRATGLYHSAVSPLWYHAIPRGCAVSWSTLYLAQVAPDAAYEQYSHAQTHLAGDVLGIGGFREWPAGRSGGRMDGDSGPIVFGVGVAATGLGLGAARLFHDHAHYAMIRRTALVVGLPWWIPSRGYALAPVLGEAILFHGRTARPWFVTLSTVPGEMRFPWLPIGLVTLDVLAIVSLLDRVARSMGRGRQRAA